MKNTKISIRAERLFAEAEKTGQLERFEEDLYSFTELLDKNYRLKLFLEDPRLLPEIKKQALDELLPDNASGLFVGLLHFLIEKGREDQAAVFSKEITRLMAKKKNIYSASLKTAGPVSREQIDKITNFCSRMINKIVVLRPKIDKNILGGFVVSFFDGKVLDFSLRYKLGQLKRQMIREKIA